MSQFDVHYLPPSPALSGKMDPNAVDGSPEDHRSPPGRSTSGRSRVTITGGQFASLNISEPPQRLESNRPLSSSPQSYPSTAYLSPPTAQSAYLSTPSSQPYSPFPVLSPDILNTDWPQADPVTGPTSSFRFQPPEESFPETSSVQTRGIHRPPSMRYVAAA